MSRFVAPASFDAPAPGRFVAPASFDAPAPGRFVAPALFDTPSSGRFAPLQSGPTTPASFPPTAEQAAIIDAARHADTLVVEALAGTGKTTTLKMLAADRPDLRALYVAYNRSVAQEARRGFPRWVNVSTAHSLAYQAIGHVYSHRLPGRDSTSRRIFARDLAKALKIRGGEVGSRRISDINTTRFAEATVKQFCLSHDMEIGPQHIPPLIAAVHGGSVEMLGELVIPAARLIWDDICNPRGMSYFTHDHYLKIWQTMGPKLPYDCVMFDEAQDANPPVAAIVGSQTHAQRVYVGDQNQQMYGWRGAVDAMSDIGGVRLALTKSFRFGPSIADQANIWLDLLGSKHRVIGHEPVGSRVERMDCSFVPDALLCRTNGGALESILLYQEAGLRVAMAPGDKDAGKDLVSFAYGARNLMAGKTSDHPDLIAFKTWSEVLEYAEEEVGGSDLARLVAVINRVGPARVISAVVNLSLSKDAEVTVSTAHKAKGLEWGSVRIGSDFTRPENPDREPTKAELREAQMVAYVSVTRAKKLLDTGSLSSADWS